MSSSCTALHRNRYYSCTAHCSQSRWLPLTLQAQESEQCRRLKNWFIYVLYTSNKKGTCTNITVRTTHTRPSHWHCHVKNPIVTLPVLYLNVTRCMLQVLKKIWESSRENWHHYSALFTISHNTPSEYLPQPATCTLRCNHKWGHLTVHNCYGRG